MTAPVRRHTAPPRRRTIPAPPAPPVLPLPTAWARERIAAARELGAVPDYGSPEWEALVADDPRKLAAALVYAEVQRYEELTAADRLRRELEEMRQAAAALELEEAIVAGAQAAMRREARTDELAGRSVASTVQQLTTVPFRDPTPVRDTPDWPWVRQPGAATYGEQLPLFGAGY